MLLLAILGYITISYLWLLIAILLVVINGYSINDYLWLFY